MANLIKQERYIFQIGTEEHLLRVQELVWGAEAWPQKFRIELHATYTREAKKFYGATALDAVEQAAKWLSPVPPTKALSGQHDRNN